MKLIASLLLLAMLLATVLAQEKGQKGEVGAPGIPGVCSGTCTGGGGSDKVVKFL